MIRGEPITILRPHITGVDQYGTPTRGWTEETIDDVLVNPSTPADTASSTQPDALEATATLYFPRTYTGGPLKGCKAIVRGREYRIIGDPMPLDGGLTPTRWNMQAQISRDDGR